MPADAASVALAPPAPSVASLLEAHPWPRELAGERRLEWLWTIDVPLAPARLWPLIADLSRLNRALRLPPMAFEERDGLRWGRARYGGIPHEWVEVPWNWVAGEWYELLRLYQRGGMRALYGVYQLAPRGEHTRLSVYYGAIPRARIFDLGIKLSFAAMGRAYRRVLPRIAEEATRAPALPPTLRAPPPPLRREAAERLDRLARGLVDAGLPAPVVARMAEWVRTADDVELERIRVRERARAWEVDEDELLRVCLHATRAGLLELTWDVICPHCRGVRDSTGALGALPASGACDACGIEFGTDAPDAVEVSFHAHSSIRPITRTVFCSAEPAHKPHVHVQRAVHPGDGLDVPAPAAPGRYRTRLRGELRHGWLEVVDGGPATVAWRAGEPPGDATAAPGARLCLLNDTDAPQTFVVETAAWLDLALRPGRLLSFQEFRDLFGEEYLGAGVQLAVGEQTILFTDVVGSTAMYAERGDPAAFVAVKAHFDTIFGIIAAHRGAVVKTIGDAAMGAFNDPVDAVRAARAIHAALPPGRGPTAIRVRASLNTGPCIAVKLNADLDYFGHAVNLAAKLQAVAGAWQVAISAATFAAPGVADYLAAEGAELTDAAIDVKGVAAPVSAKVWTVAQEPAA